MSEFTQDVLLVVVGWILGMLGAPLLEVIREHRAAAALKASLAIELDELQRRLALDAFVLADHLGAFDRSLLRWLVAAHQDYRGLHVDPESVKLLAEFAVTSDSTIDRFNQNRTHGTGRTLIPKKVYAPILESTTTALPNFDAELQQKLLEIRRWLFALEDNRAAIQEQYNLTFTQDGARQKDKLVTNIGITSRLWLDAAKAAADVSQSVVLALRSGA